ncbi:unnamed protein product, partial [Mesorhabditis spiculigera]
MCFKHCIGREDVFVHGLRFITNSKSRMVGPDESAYGLASTLLINLEHGPLETLVDWLNHTLGTRQSTADDVPRPRYVLSRTNNLE